MEPNSLWEKVGTVSAEDWARDDVMLAYSDYGRHIGKRFIRKGRDYPDTFTITGFRGDGCVGVAVTYSDGGFDYLSVFDKGHSLID